MPSVELPPATGIDFISDPQVIARDRAMLYGLRNVNVQLLPFNASYAMTPSKSQIVGDPPNLILPIGLQLGAPIANAAATTADNTRAINQLLSALRITTQLPS